MLTVLKNGDFPSGRLMFQPGTKNVASRIDVAIVRRPAFAAFPVPHSKRAHTFRTAGGNSTAARARLGTVSFVSFDNHGSVPSGLVAEHMPELRPSSVKNGLCHPCLGEGGGVHIADDDQTILPDNPSGLFVKMVTAGIGDLGMDRLDPLLVSRPLSASEYGLKLSIVSEGRNLPAIGQCREVFQAKVNADAPAPGGQVVGNLALECDIPAPASIFDKAASATFAFDFSGLPEAKAAFEVNGAVAVNLRGARDEGYPSQGPLTAKTGAKAGTAVMLIAGLGELATDCVSGIRVDTQFGSTTNDHLIEINAREAPGSFVAMPATLSFALRSNTEVPYLIAGDRMAAEVSVPALDAILEGDDAQSGPVLSLSGLVKSASSPCRAVARSSFVSPSTLWRNALPHRRDRRGFRDGSLR